MKKLFLVLCFALNLSVFGGEKGYDAIEDKATIPLLTPTFSERKVAKIRLSNGLEAHLISDPKTEESAASLSVEVGSWNDPEEYPGTAHFLEHMLFMGTKRFPNERDYLQYIQDNGGLANAYTTTDHTAYLFAISNPAFEGAYLRFSHFFVDPLFATSSIDRELHAVDQEHSKNIEEDNWREWMIFKETGNPHHPNVKFSTGNAQTLQGIPQEVLKKWYSTHYSAQVMHLTVISNLPLDKLIQLTVDNFSAVPSFTPAKSDIDLPITSPKQRGHFTYIQPVKDLRQLVLTWELPSSFASDLDTHSPRLVSYALTHGGEKGLLHKLKSENLAEDLGVDSDRLGKKTLLFQLRVALTPQGLSQLDTVIERCFEAISRLKASGIPPELFQEFQTECTLHYQYQSREKAFDTAMKNSSLIVYELLETYPEKSSIPTNYNPATLSTFIEHLTPQNALFYLEADPTLTGIPTDTKEKWMGASYTIQSIPKAKLLTWQEINPSSSIQLPDPNPYLPENLELKKQPANAPTYEKPALLYNQNDGKVYFAADTIYQVPEVGYTLSIKSPLIDGSAKRQALLNLFLLALSDKTTPQTSFARRAGLTIAFAPADLSLQLDVTGFSDKAPDLTLEMIKSLKQCLPTQAQFLRYKEELLTDLDNQTKNPIYKQAAEMASHLLTNYAPTASEKLNALQEVTYEGFLTYAQDLFAKSFVEATLYGNLTQTEANSLWEGIKSALQAKPFPPAEHFKKEVLSIAAHQGPFVCNFTTPRQGNCVLLTIDEAPFTYENRAAETILASALYEGFFNTLRTKQQTGYIALSWSRDIERRLFQSFLVQSSTHSPNELLARFDLFLEDFLRNFEDNLSKERFETIRLSRIDQLAKKPDNSGQMTTLIHGLAFEYDGQFDLKNRRIDALKNISYETVQQFAQSTLSRANTRRLAILMEGAPATERPFRYEPITKEALKDKSAYVAWK